MNIGRHLFTDLPLPGEMRAWDEASAKDYGMPPAVMMENAARAALEELEKRRPVKGRRILIAMGKGNNGGDGAAMARMLHDAGHKVLLCATTALTSLPGPAAEHAAAARLFGVPLVHARGESFPDLPEEWQRPDVIIDALTGTGLAGALRPRELAFVRAVNALGQGAFVLALDSPSGLCGEKGLPLPEAVRADLTVAFEAPVRGLYLGRAAEYRGELVCRRVGMPLALRKTSASWQLLAPAPHADFAPPPGRHKGRAGRVLVIGGSHGMTGAARLAALGALRAGCGLAHIAVPGSLAHAAQADRPEFICHAVGAGRAFSAADTGELLELVGRIAPQALVFGPGLGRDEATRPVVQAILELLHRPPAVVDADALFHLGAIFDGNPEYQPPAPLSQDVLTPHPGEAARLLPPSFFDSPGDTGQDLFPMADCAPEAGKEAPFAEGAHSFDARPEEKGPPGAALGQKTHRVQADRPAALKALCRRFPSVVVLKGAHSLIGRTGQRTVLAPFDEAALAVGGSGDVLSGVIAALLAAGLPAMEAACFGVHLHGRAGALLGQKAPLGHLASDIADAVPLAWKELCPCTA